MKLSLLFLLLSVILTVHSEESLAIDNRITVATRLSHYDKSIETGDYLSESTLIAEHQYQSIILAWRLNNQLYQDPKQAKLESTTEFELSELSYSFSLLESENDFWQIGKFNQPLDPGYVLRSIDFFEKENNPFDDFSSHEGINMASLSLWLDSYYLSLIVALEGATEITEDLKQWAMVLQRDFDALSTSLLVQQYEKNHLGFGTTFTYVLGDNWAFHGSGFIRQGSLWQSQFNNYNQNKSDHNENGYPKLALGTLWTTQYWQILMEYSYQKEKLNSAQLAQIQAFQPQSYYQTSHYQTAITPLYQQRYQQHYFFTQLQYSFEDHTITANSLIGKDISALSQLKYQYLSGFNLSYWLSLELTSGKTNTEFTRIPWKNRLQIGLQWKI